MENIHWGRLALGGRLDTCTFTIGHALEDVLFDIATGKSTDEHWTRLLEDPKHGVRRLGYRFRRATRWMGRDNHAFVN